MMACAGAASAIVTAIVRAVRVSLLRMEEVRLETGGNVAAANGGADGQVSRSRHTAVLGLSAWALGSMQANCENVRFLADIGPKSGGRSTKKLPVFPYWLRGIA